MKMIDHNGTDINEELVLDSDSEHEKIDRDREQLSKTVVIEVNGHQFEIPGVPTSGLEIKQATIRQGISIEACFVLQLALSNGMARVIGDGDVVQICENLSFTAIAPDDNS